MVIIVISFKIRANKSTTNVKVINTSDMYPKMILEDFSYNLQQTKLDDPLCRIKVQ